MDVFSQPCLIVSMKKEIFIAVLLLLVLYMSVFLVPGNLMLARPYPSLFVCLIGTFFILLCLVIKKIAVLTLVGAVSSSAFLFGVLILVTIQSTWGIIEGLNAPSDKCFITGSFPDVVSFLTFICINIPFVVWLGFKYKKNLLIRILTSVTLILCFVTVWLSHSRTAFIAIVVMALIPTLVKLAPADRWKLMGIYTISVLVVCFACFLLLQNVKTSSTKGRTLILKISLEMIKENPIFGFGYKGFEKNYMSYQADYVRQHDELEEQNLYLLDNIKNPLNVFVETTVNYGVVGLMALLLSMALILCKVVLLQGVPRTILLMLYGAVCVFMLFSYPFEYASNVFLICIYALTLFPIEKTLIYIIGLKGKLFVLLIGLCLFMAASRFYYQCQWLSLLEQYSSGSKSDVILDRYESSYIYLKKNPYFLYNYAFVLYDLGEYEVCERIAKENLGQMNDYESNFLYAKTLWAMKKYDEALDVYELLTDMIPSKFMPIYCMFEIYKEIGNRGKARYYAQQLMEKKVKVVSAQILFMRQSAFEYLKEQRQKNGYV